MRIAPVEMYFAIENFHINQCSILAISLTIFFGAAKLEYAYILVIILKLFCILYSYYQISPKEDS